MPADIKTVKLTKPFEVHGQTVDSIQIREPNGGTYVRIGDPFLTIFTASGSAYQVEREDAIRSYLETCIVKNEDLGADVIKFLGIEDMMAVKEGLFSFFTEAAARRAAAKLTAATKSTGSYSDSGSSVSATPSP